MLSLFDKLKRDNYWGPFLKASGVTTKFPIHFYSSEQSLFKITETFFDHNVFVTIKYLFCKSCNDKAFFDGENSEMILSELKVKFAIHLQLI